MTRAGTRVSNCTKPHPIIYRSSRKLRKLRQTSASECLANGILRRTMPPRPTHSSAPVPDFEACRGIKSLEVLSPCVVTPRPATSAALKGQVLHISHPVGSVSHGGMGHVQCHIPRGAFPRKSCPVGLIIAGPGPASCRGHIHRVCGDIPPPRPTSP